MPRRKTYPIPIVPSCKLHRALRTARRAAWDLSETPWLRNCPEALKAFYDVFQLICRAQDILSRNYEAVLQASQKE